MATTTQDLQKEMKKTAETAVQSAKTTVDAVQRDLTDAAGDVRDAVQKVFLAGLGALAVAEEEGSKVFKTLVKKGETVELPGLGAQRVQEIRKQLESRADQAQDAVEGRVKDARFVASETADKAEGRLHEAVAATMKRLGVPTRAEISELTASVERLTTHIDRLKEERTAATASTEVTMEAVGGGWYEVRIGSVVVEKVQGRDEAEAAVTRVQEQRG